MRPAIRERWTCDVSTALVDQAWLPADGSGPGTCKLREGLAGSTSFRSAASYAGGLLTLRKSSGRV